MNTAVALHHPVTYRSPLPAAQTLTPSPGAPRRGLADTADRVSFEGLVARLHQVAECIDVQGAGAEAALADLLKQLQFHADPRCTGLVVFASALAQRLQGRTGEQANLYLRRFQVPQIQLFNLLGRHVPMVSLATRIANDALALALGAQDHAVLMDVGIGTGRQFAALLGDLAANARLPQRLTVVGIEPAAEALGQARSALQALALDLGIDLRFHGFAVGAEALSNTDWQLIQSLCSTRPAINAAFALHHIADDAQGGEQRRSVLRRLRGLDPLCLVLSEPDVDHVEPRFLQRFRNCFAHFSAVFALLDLLTLDQADRDALKVGFFGREIVDILGADEHQRSERHQRAATWVQHLASTGFAVQPPLAVLPSSTHPAVSVALSGPRAVIRAIDEPVVSVLVAVPRPVGHNKASGFDAFAMGATPI